MTPVSAGISNGENNQSDGTPTICEIMECTTQHREISDLKVEGNKDICLIGDVSNNGLAETGMCLYEMAEYPEHVDIIGTSDNIQDGMKSVPIGTYCAVVTSATDKCHYWEDIPNGT
eukprot:7316037-Ditylum_brightwellii.AAC.1